MFFFTFLFPSYYHYVIYRVVSTISDGCNQSLFVFFYVHIHICMQTHKYTIKTSGHSSYLQLSRISCAPSYISLFYANSIKPVDSQGYPLTSSTGFTCYLHRCISYFDSLPGRRSIYNNTSLFVAFTYHVINRFILVNKKLHLPFSYVLLIFALI